MKVTLLYFDGCPHWKIADERLGRALGRAGRDDVVVERVLIESAEDAEATGFGGSPTILVDGDDPFGGRIASGLACRVYATEQGYEGSPSVEQLLSALQGN